ncbi:MAG: carboxypeptidase-like regulatory domain-containing protein, partial [Limisphaerales bacterium]
MQIRRSVFWFIIIVAVLIALVLWHGKKKPIETPQPVAVETNVAPPAATVRSAPVNAPVHTNMPPAVSMTNAVQTPPPSKWEQMQSILATQNDVPIVFYGRLEDQFGNPVADAQIAASIRIENGVEHTVKHFSLTSDANGFFTVSGYKGQSLSVIPKKAGYALASLNGGGIYSHMWPESQRYIPDPNNPTVIKMWKLQGAEPLVNINQHYKLHYTGAPINFDLVAGKIVPTGGDVRITVNRPAGEISMRNKQDWGFEIGAVDGGLMESGADAAVTYAAPLDGYEPSDTLTASGNGHGIELIQQSFFIKSRNGQVYSKLSLSFDINETPDGLMDISFSGVANPNRSRNWE